MNNISESPTETRLRENSVKKRRNSKKSRGGILRREKGQVRWLRVREKE
jgi:hypothetical protein